MSSPNRKSKLTARERKKRRASRKRLLKQRKANPVKRETPEDRRRHRSKRETTRRERVKKIKAHALDPEGNEVFMGWMLFIFANVILLCILVRLIPEDWHFVLAIFGIPYGIIVLLLFLFRLFVSHHDLVDKHGLMCPKCGRSSIRGPFSRRPRFSRPDNPAICFACRKDILDA